MGRSRRLLARPRWPEYRGLLRDAKDAGYEVVSLQDWVLSGCDRTHKTLVLRHDVDQVPNSVPAMARIEAELDVTSTWYFRWRTANRRVLDDLRESGHSVGFHFETLSHAARNRQIAVDKLDSRKTIKRLRRVLLDEIAAFEACFGPVTTIAAHGDTRVPEASNRHLSRSVAPARWGMRFDADEAVREARLALKVTDRVQPGAWSGGKNPHAALASGRSPILCLTHPNNWASGPARVWDRGIRVPIRSAVTRVQTRDLSTSVDTPRTARVSAARGRAQAT
jgi:hypothetical protein